MEVLVMTRLDGLFRGLGACALVLPLGFGILAPSTVAAQANDEDDQLFRVERIEIAAFGSWLGGASYLDLPAPLTPLTNDTASEDILDFGGLAPDPRVEAPHKELEPGWSAGMSTTFYLTPNFGLSLTGAFGQSDAVFTGQEVFIVPDPDDPLGQDVIEVLQPRSEIDRATVSTWTGTAGIIYHILAERKHNTRPFVTLGIGGILNQFPDTDDVSALTWNVGLGIGFPIAGSFRGYVSTQLRFYVWETDEVDLDETLVFPEISAGIVWRHIVPEEEPEDEFDDLLPGADDPDEPADQATESGEGNAG
jgi:hypothetical protein